MKPILIAPFLSVAFLFPAAAQENRTITPPLIQHPELTIAQREALEELNEAARSYREGNFAEAQLHSEKAQALDPLNKNAPLFVARTIHAQYKPGDFSEENVAKAREAIDAYKQILKQDPGRDEGYKAIAYLYGAVKDEALLRQWLFQRAIDVNVSEEERAEAYVVLASKDWDCSFKVTELPSNKTTSIRRRRTEVHYQMPKDPAEFDRAQGCASDGLEMIEAAITLTPSSEVAWSYKTNLLLELAKLSEMNHDLQLATEYTKQANSASRTTEELRNLNATGPVK